MGAIRYRMRCRLRTEWPSAVALAAAVAVVGGLVLVLVAGALRTSTAPDRYEEARGDRYATQMEQAEGRPLTEEVEALPAVEDVVSGTFMFAGFLGHDGVPIDAAIAFVGDADAFGAELSEGRLPEPTSPHEFVASPDFVELTGAAVGDLLPFISISEATAEEFGFDAETPDGPSFDATLVGVVEAPAADLQDGFALTVFPLSLLDEGSIGVAATESLVALVDGTDVGELRAQLDTLPAGSDLTLDPAQWVDPDVRRAVSTQANALWVIAGIIAVAGLIVVVQVASGQARVSTDQRAALSAVGLTRLQLLADALGRIAVPAAVGAIAALVLAVALSDTFPIGFVRDLEPDPGLRFEPLVHALGAILLVGGLVAWVGALLVVGGRGERRRRPISAVEARAVKMGRVGPAMGLRFAFARHPRDAGRVSTPVAGLFAVLVVLVGSVTFATSLDALLDEPGRQGIGYDALIGQGGGPVPPELASELAEDPDVEALVVMGSIRVSVDDAGFDLTGYDSVEGPLWVRMLDGSVPTEVDQIALGQTSATDLGVGVGDQLSVQAATGARRLDVVGIAVVPGVEGADGLGDGGLVTAETLRALDEGAVLSSVAIGFRPGTDVPSAQSRISDATGGQRVGRPDRPTAIGNLGRVRSAPYIVSGILAGLALLSLAGLVVVVLHHRSKEIAVLRALGADRRRVGGVAHWHAVSFTVVVALLATPFGVAVGRLVFRLTIAERIGVAPDTVVPVLGLLVLLLVLVVAADVGGQIAVRRRSTMTRQLAPE